jgi:hypothetical protein
MASRNKIFEDPRFEGLCSSINHAGNTIIVGGRNGHLLVRLNDLDSTWLRKIVMILDRTEILHKIIYFLLP